MRIWIGMVGFLLLLLLLFTVTQWIQSVVYTGETVPESLLQAGLAASPLVKITGTDHYYGTEPLVLLYGIDRGGKEMVVFMDEKGKMLHYDWLEKSFSRDKIDQWIKERYPESRKIHIVPGLENGIYLWEALYQTKEGKYLYVYFRFREGTFLRSIALAP
ncbi:hypothetical protein [Thermicanus aegyptius]|uniref:hypothetical protein n=1 Tax=Thermicanus aegyptius TaxID=94009 RepID=UPI0004117E95|nr:hypothetical protein [Thermicanus aegyptius]